jgi:hypothetical protein
MDPRRRQRRRWPASRARPETEPRRKERQIWREPTKEIEADEGGRVDV